MRSRKQIALCGAIRDRRIVRCTYNGQRRVVRPHQLFRNDRGELMLMGWQVDGRSNSRRVPCWVNMHVDRISGLRVTEKQFHRPQPDYDPAAHGKSICEL